MLWQQLSILILQIFLLYLLQLFVLLHQFEGYVLHELLDVVCRQVSLHHNLGGHFGAGGSQCIDSREGTAADLCSKSKCEWLVILGREARLAHWRHEACAPQAEETLRAKYM